VVFRSHQGFVLVEKEEVTKKLKRQLPTDEDCKRIQAQVTCIPAVVQRCKDAIRECRLALIELGQPMDELSDGDIDVVIKALETQRGRKRKQITAHTDDPKELSEGAGVPKQT